jgi:site-specific recombinase XerD
MSIYLNERTPNKHKPFDDASPDVVEYVRYLEVIAGKSARTAFSYYCDLRNFSRYMKRRRALVADDTPMKEIDPKGLDTAFWGSVTKEDVYEYLYFLGSECGNKKSSTARRLASLHGFYDYMVNHIGKLTYNPTASISPPKLDKVLPKYLTEKQSLDLLESAQYHSDFPERDYCMVVLFLNCGMRLSELVGMNLGDIDLSMRQIRLFGKGHKERIVYLNDACMEALELYLAKRNTMEGLLPDEKAVFVTRRRKTRITNRRVEQLITGAMEAAGLKGFSTHKLRHTAATLMYQTGHVDILTLKELLGHSSLSTTQIYTHLNGAQVRAAVEANPLGNARVDAKSKESGVQTQVDALNTSEIELPEPQRDRPATVVVLPETDGAHLPSEMLYTSDSDASTHERQLPDEKR